MALTGVVAEKSAESIVQQPLAELGGLVPGENTIRDPKTGLHIPRPSHVALPKHLLPIAIAQQARLPLLLWGSPGIGKSKTIEAISRALKEICEPVIGAVHEPPDLVGWPVPAGDYIKFLPMEQIIRLVQAGKGTLFLDELSCSPPAMQAAMLRLILERTAGTLKLPIEVGIMMAANPPEQAAGGFSLSMPLANRIIHMDFEFRVDAWIEGMSMGWPEYDVPVLPSDWRKGILSCQGLVASFIRTTQQLALKVPKPGSDEAGKAWASPRAWNLVAEVLAACWAIKAPDAVTRTLVIGCVGAGGGTQFCTWLASQSLPNPQEILAKPSLLKGMNQGDLYRSLKSMVEYTLDNLTQDTWDASWGVLEWLADNGQVDMALPSAGELIADRRSHREAGDHKLRFRIPQSASDKVIPQMEAAGVPSR